MRQLLLDTSIIIDFLRQKDKEKTLLFQLSADDLHVSIITHTELYSGKSAWEKLQAKQELSDLFSGITVLPLETEVSLKAGQLRAQLNHNSLIDCIIAATAMTHQIPLVTLNVKDFQKIQGLILYQ